MMWPERCLRITGSTARATFIGPIRLAASCRSICFGAEKSRMQSRGDGMDHARISCALILCASQAFAANDSKVTVGSPEDQFPRNAQHEPALAVDPSNPLVVAAAVNDYIDEPACTPDG